MARKPAVPTACPVCGRKAVKRRRCVVCGRLVGICCAYHMKHGREWVCVTADHLCLRTQITRHGR